MPQKLLRQRAILPGFKVLALLLLSGCSAGRWMLLPDPVVDKSVGKVVSTEYRMSVESLPTANRPVFSFRLMEIQRSEYPLRLAKERSMQYYKPSLITWGTGFSASLFLIALGRGWISSMSVTAPGMYTLAGTSLLIGTSMQLKPAGEPIYTGEKSILKQIGTTVLVDSFPARAAVKIPVRFEAFHPSIGRIALNQFWNKDRLDIDLSVVADWIPLQGEDLGNLQVAVTTDEKTDSLKIPLQSFMRGFVEITRPRTVLYIKPVALPSASLTELGPPSRFPYVKRENANWLEIQYGITPCYVESRRVRQVWILSPSLVEQRVVAEAVPFGRVDIERDIPTKWRQKTTAKALIISRPGTYGTEPKKNQSRDNKLFSFYLTEYFGLDPANIATLNDSTKSLKTEVSDMKETFFDGSMSTLYVYLNGVVSSQDSTFSLTNSFTGTRDSLAPLLSDLAKRKFKRFILVTEVGFSEHEKVSEKWVLDYMNAYTIHLQNQNKEFGFFQAAMPGERTFDYMDPRIGVDKMHGLFSYVFFNGLRLGYHDFTSMKRYLETDVLYFSRKFRDKAQRPIVLGTTKTLLPE